MCKFFPFLFLLDVGLTNGNHIKVGHDEEQEEGESEEVKSGDVRSQKFAEFVLNAGPVRQENIVVSCQ